MSPQNNISLYEIDSLVFDELEPHKSTIEHWYGKASEIGDYVATWGVLRFWVMSRSQALHGNAQDRQTSSQQSQDRSDKQEDEKSYIAWAVARKVLCNIAGTHFGIAEDLDTKQFKEKFYDSNLTFNHQILLSELLIEIADAVQFWAVRFKEEHDMKEQAKSQSKPDNPESSSTESPSAESGTSTTTETSE